MENLFSVACPNFILEILTMRGENRGENFTAGGIWLTRDETDSNEPPKWNSSLQDVWNCDQN